MTTKPNYKTMTKPQLIDAFEQFRKDVVEAATEAARENGWCGQVNDVLRDLALDDLLPARSRRVTLVLDVELDDHDETPEGGFEWAELALVKIRDNYVYANELADYSETVVPE